MVWNHRVLKQNFDLGSDDFSKYIFAEVYYDDDGNPNGWSECHMTGDDLYELATLVTLLDKALKEPVLLVDSDGNLTGEEE